MNRGSVFALVCPCGAEFASRGALKIHENACAKSKQRLSTILEKVQGAIASRKQKESTELIAKASDDLPIVGAGHDLVEEVNLILYNSLYPCLIVVVGFCFGGISNNQLSARGTKGRKTA